MIALLLAGLFSSCPAPLGALLDRQPPPDRALCVRELRAQALAAHQPGADPQLAAKLRESFGWVVPRAPNGWHVLSVPPALLALLDEVPELRAEGRWLLTWTTDSGAEGRDALYAQVCPEAPQEPGCAQRPPALEPGWQRARHECGRIVEVLAWSFPGPSSTGMREWEYQRLEELEATVQVSPGCVALTSAGVAQAVIAPISGIGDARLRRAALCLLDATDHLHELIAGVHEGETARWCGPAIDRAAAAARADPAIAAQLARGLLVRIDERYEAELAEHWAPGVPVDASFIEYLRALADAPALRPFGVLLLEQGEAHHLRGRDLVYAFACGVEPAPAICAQLAPLAEPSWEARNQAAAVERRAEQDRQSATTGEILLASALLLVALLVLVSRTWGRRTAFELAVTLVLAVFILPIPLLGAVAGLAGVHVRAQSAWNAPVKLIGGLIWAFGVASVVAPAVAAGLGAAFFRAPLRYVCAGLALLSCPMLFLFLGLRFR